MCVNVLLTGLLVFTPLLKFTFFCVSIIKIHTGYLLSIIKRNMPNQNIRLLTVKVTYCKRVFSDHTNFVKLYV